MEKNDSKDTEESVQDVGRCLSATAGRAEWKEGELAQWVCQSQFCEPVRDPADFLLGSTCAAHVLYSSDIS